MMDAPRQHQLLSNGTPVEGAFTFSRLSLATGRIAPLLVVGLACALLLN
jgi:hypothetical protein